MTHWPLPARELDPAYKIIPCPLLMARIIFIPPILNFLECTAANVVPSTCQLILAATMLVSPSVWFHHKRWNPFQSLTRNLSICLFCSAIRVSTAARAAVHVLISAVHSMLCSQCFSDISVQKRTLEVLVSRELSDGADGSVVWRPTPGKILCRNQRPTGCTASTCR